ncbi:unnamed protein product [Diatraea saccharalis]|uniref:SUN domain-containing protein n=1 Tax=Diatraea saccharalis TaxID=40085 RepID=A0A9N9R9E2_9NEOP|nr:unnamed protein product [Diatraea saccharalis]
MDYDEENGEGCFRNVFRSFVCVSLTLLLGLHVYAYFWGSPHDGLDEDFSDVRYVVTQLTRGLTEVNRKHERLKGEMERLSSALPIVAAAADRAKDALGPSLGRSSRGSLEIIDYDRQMADYALETAGGRILDTGDTTEHVIYESPVSWALHVFTEISSAPRIIQFEGLEFRSDPYPHDFGSFEYDKNGKPIQYFEARHPTSKGYNMVRVRVVTNWGHPVYTCVYRVRVHGELVSGQAPRIISDDTELKIENE